MQYTNFSQNSNHKLCNFCFSDLRLDGNFELMQEREIRLRNEAIGIAKVVALRTFNFGHLTDELAYNICGHNAQYLRSILKKMHGNVDPWRMVSWVVFQWLKPDLNAWANVYQDAWHSNVEKFVTAYRDTPEGKSLQFALDL